jgi:hypothetical protein
LSQSEKQSTIIVMFPPRFRRKKECLWCPSFYKRSWILRLSSRVQFCRFSSNKQYAKITIFGIALQFELWYCKNDLNGPLIFNFNLQRYWPVYYFSKLSKLTVNDQGDSRDGDFGILFIRRKTTKLNSTGQP